MPQGHSASSLFLLHFSEKASRERLPNISTLSPSTDLLYRRDELLHLEWGDLGKQRWCLSTTNEGLTMSLFIYI